MGFFINWGPFFIKTTAALCLLIAFGVGCDAHVSSREWREPDMCLYANSGNNTTDPIVKTNCPKKVAVPMELVFIAITVILLLISVFMIIFGLVKGEPNIRKCDTAYCIIAGVLLIIAAALIITAGVLIDNYLAQLIKEKYDVRGSWWYSRRGSYGRDHYSQYDNKIAAGVFAILAAILYFGAAYVICAFST